MPHWEFPVVCVPQSIRPPQPNRLHGVVEPFPRRFMLVQVFRDAIARADLLHGAVPLLVTGVQAECFVSPLLLRNYDVVIDYPARQFILAEAGTLKNPMVAE